MKVEIYSDVACPWCYIGEARFERALRALPYPEEVEVVWRPYQLDPDAPAEALPLLQRLAERYGLQAANMAAHVAEVADGEGLTMNFDQALAANTLDAHRLLRYAEREHGAATQRAVATQLFRAHFTDGSDVGNVEVLAGIAAAAGMDAARVREHLRSGADAEAVRQEVAAAQHLGISAVPTFVFNGRYAVQGAQPTAAFLQALETISRDSSSAAVEGAPSCADGACTAS